MPPNIALYLCLGFIFWLFYRDYRRGATVSPALWIPLLWLLIIGSRPISTWLGFGSTSDPLEGSPADRLLFLLLIVAAVLVLIRRNLNLSSLVRDNRWLFWFYAYLGLSVLWSDYPLVSFKRWIKDFGNVMMALVVLSDKYPMQATRSLLARCCYFLIPLSVLLVKYFPELGRSYDDWNGQTYYTGVTLGKNLLGMTLFGCAMALIWIVSQLRTNRPNAGSRLDLLIFLFLGVLTVWLFGRANSATAVVCTCVGGLTLVAIRSSAFRKRLGWFALLNTAAVVLVIGFALHMSLDGGIASLAGRNMTMTGRTQIWSAVLDEDTNPLIGTGFYSFWLGDRNARLSAEYHYELGTAHSSYIELYLNSGWIGLLLFSAVLVSTMSRGMREVMRRAPLADFRFACLVAAIGYGLTEAVFCRLSLIWFLLLLACIQYSGQIQTRKPLSPIGYGT